MRRTLSAAIAPGLLALCVWNTASAQEANDAKDAVEVTAAATAPVEAEVLVVLGSTEGGEVDAALDALPALKKAPFDSFSSKQLLSKARLKLKPEEAAEVELPNGRKLRLVWLGLGEGGRYRVQVSINRPGKKDYLPVMTVAAAAGDPFFVAGQKYQGGTLIIGVRVGQAPAAKSE